MNELVIKTLIEALPPEQRVVWLLAQRIGTVETSLGDLTAEVSQLAADTDASLNALRQRGSEIQERLDGVSGMKIPESVVASQHLLADMKREFKTLADAVLEISNEVTEINAFLDSKWRHNGRDEAKEEARQKAAEERTNGKRGKYCLHCGKVLNPEKRNQRIFCSPRHSHLWREAHPGETPYPRTKLKDTIVAGEGVESDAYAN